MRGDAGLAGRAQEAACVAQRRGLGGARGHPALAPQGRFLRESADVRWAARVRRVRGGREATTVGYWRRRRSGGASARTRARRTPPRHAMLPHLGAMLRRRARRGERGEKKVCEAQATKGGLGLSVSLRRRACTRLCLLLQLQSAKCTPLIRLRFRGTSRARSERYKAVGPPRESRWNVVGVPTRKSLVELPKLLFFTKAESDTTTRAEHLTTTRWRRCTHHERHHLCGSI